MASTTSAMPTKDTTFDSDSSDGQARGGRRQLQQVNTGLPPLPTSSGLSQPAGQLLRGAVDDQGKNTKAALMVGIKLDLEAEVHLTARVRGDIAIGLY
ncbi:hypothetical protein PG985_004346 [Apiospora marii]|uniref:Uncharacterized protein n=1 Tax=Apiospora marii TaxID=335849 RepID=A0ABR1S918_9PEZI